MRTLTATFHFPDGTSATGTLEATSPDLSAPVRWTGDADRISALPRAILHRCDVDTFLAEIAGHAADLRGRFEWEAVGEYELLAV